MFIGSPQPSPDPRPHPQSCSHGKCHCCEASALGAPLPAAIWTLLPPCDTLRSMLWKVLESWSQVGRPLSFPASLPEAQQEAAGLAPSHSVPFHPSPGIRAIVCSQAGQAWEASSPLPPLSPGLPAVALGGHTKASLAPLVRLWLLAKGRAGVPPFTPSTPSPVGADEPHSGDRAKTHRFPYRTPNSWAVLLPGWQSGGCGPWGWRSLGVREWPRPGHRSEGSQASSTAEEATSSPRAPGACCILGSQRGWPPRSPWAPRLGATVVRAAPPAELLVVFPAGCWEQAPHFRML